MVVRCCRAMSDEACGLKVTLTARTGAAQITALCILLCLSLQGKMLPFPAGHVAGAGDQRHETSLEQQSMHEANASAPHLLCMVLQDAVQQPLTNVVNTLEQKRIQQHKSRARLDSMTTMITHNKTHAQENRECHTCGRRLAEGREMDEFFNRQVAGHCAHVVAGVAPWESDSLTPQHGQPQHVCGVQLVLSAWPPPAAGSCSTSLP